MPEFIPRPDLLFAKRVLAVQPHPDDNEIGAGATIARLAAQGAEIRYVTVTDGSMGTSDLSTAPAKLAERRRGEADRAAAILGVTQSIHLGFRDLLDSPLLGLRERLLQQIAEYRPDFVLTCDPWLPYEAHPDHRNVGLAVSEAVSFMGFPHVPGAPKQAPPQPMVAFYGTARPNVRIPAGPYWDSKWRAIGAHETQFAEHFLPVMRAFFEAQAGGGDGFHEAFKVLHPIYLHFNPGAVDA
ncbi:MAG: PIG-L family deacetylase [Thermaerobacter sp.]|nr:PIG-L family deacetylase [Thermaerobacter sp.]